MYRGMMSINDKCGWLCKGF